MSWAAGDAPHVEQAKIDLVRLRSTAYALRKTIDNISHDEKRKALLTALAEVDNGVIDIERTLTR